MSRTRIVKLGGSLLELPDLAKQFERWLTTQHAASQLLVVVGGGKWVNRLRSYTAADQRRLHWLAIRIMDRNARRFARTAKLPSWHGDPSDVIDPNNPATDGCTVLTGVAKLLASAQASQDNAELPQAWAVTSDSIAAWVARRTGACELILLKSCWPPGARPSIDSNSDGIELLDHQWPMLIQNGYVDEYFETAAKDLRIRVVNLGA